MRKWYQEERLAIVDLGTNAIRLNVYEGHVSIYQEKTFTGLGSMLAKNGELSIKGKEIVWRKIKGYRKILSLLEVTQTIVLATEALRSCKNSEGFIDQLIGLEGMTLRILSGEEEAKFLSKGVLRAFPKANGLVCDCGGGSMELINIKDGFIGDLRSFPYGVMRMQSILSRMRNAKSYVKSMLEENSWISSIEKGKTLYVTGGTWRMLAHMFMSYKKYPLCWVNNYRPNPEDFLEYIKEIPELNFKESSFPRMVNQSRLLKVAAILFENFLRIVQPCEIVFCAYGLREGYLSSLLEVGGLEDTPLVSYARYEARGSDRATIKNFPEHLKNFSLPKNLLWAAYFLAVMKNDAPIEHKGNHAFLNIINLPLVGCTHKEFVFLAYSVGLSFGKVDLLGKKADIINYFLNDEDKKVAQELSLSIKPL